MRDGLRRGAALLGGALVLAGGCATPAKPPPPPAPLRFDWREAALPVPPGPAGRVAVRDATNCSGRWYLAGAVIGADGGSRPAAWSSPDGQAWQSIKTAPISFYGEQDILYTAACRDGVLATVGGKSGGAHGNPRVSTWYLKGDTLQEVVAAFTTYGGPDAVDVARIAAGPGGFLIAGNRISGGAVWLSPDATEFRLIEAATGLASDPAVDTSARDATATATGWTVVGGGTKVGHVERDPLVFTSDDGEHWTRVAVPGGAGYTELQRVVSLGDESLAVGLRGATFGAWRGKGTAWRPVGQFGATGHANPSSVRSVTFSGRTAFASATDGATYGVWASIDRGQIWRTVTLPAAQPAGSERNVNLVTAGDSVLLLADDARQGRVWIAHLSG